MAHTWHEAQSAPTHADDEILVAVVDRGIRLIEAHHALVAMSGRRAEDLAGRALGELLPALAARLEPSLRAARDTGEPAVVPAGFPGSQHEPAPYFRCQPVRARSGTVVAIEILAPADSLSASPELSARRASPAQAPAGSPVATAASVRRWRDLLSTIEQGFCIFEMIYDDAGVAVDYRFLEVNRTFEHHTGLKEVVGKTARELVPGLEDVWVQTYARVAETGERLRFEHGSEAMGRWFEVEAVPVGGPQSREVALLFTNITARKRAEADARFRTEVSEQIRVATRAEPLLAAVTEMLGRHLGASRCCVIEVDEASDSWVIRHDYRATPDLPSNTGAHAISTYPPVLVDALRSGRVITSADTAVDPRTAAVDLVGFQPLGARAFIAVPLLHEGRLVAAYVAFASEPRVWAQHEIALLEAVAEQAWSAIDQLRSLARLEASQTSLALALAAGQAGTFIWDIRRNLNSWSPQLEALYGVPPGTFEGTYEAWSGRVNRDDLSRVEAGLQRALAGRQREYDYEFRAIMPDGTQRWLAGRACFDYDADGTPLRMLGLNVDIDERKRGEQALRQAHRRLALALERLDGFLYEFEPGSEVVERSEGFARVLGYTAPPPHAGRSWWIAHIHPDDRERVVGEVRAAQEGDAAGYSLEYRVRHGDGHYLTFWDRGMIERDDQGRAVRVLGTRINITERKQAEAERIGLLQQVQQALQATEAALSKAEAATRERDLLISIAAHDLRSPLTVILGQAQLLHRRAARIGLGERDQRTAAMIAEQAARLNQMIDALLDLSRIQEGRLTIERQPLDLTELIERVADDVRTTSDAHALVLQTPGSALVLHADPIRMEQVFHNLLGNAVKYSPNGGTITVTLTREAGVARVAIRDEGIGIPAAALPNLFTRFYRAPNATAQTTSSMGVGLFVVRQLVQAHGGTVMAESAEGRGSTFVVELPLDPQ